MYLKNDLVSFKPLFKIRSKQNIVSTCFFRRYKNKQYKEGGFDRYLAGLQELNDKTKQIGFRVRMFIDEAIYEDDVIMKRLRKLPMIDLVVFDCPLFKKDGYHIGLFGTFIRFFPMFDFPNNDANIIIISDIDDIVAFKKYLPRITKKDIYLDISTNISRHFKNKEQFDMIYKDKLVSYFKPQEMLIFKSLPKSILMDFFSSLDMHYAYTYYLHPDLDTTTLKYEMKYGEVPFVYGCDEYFLNQIMFKSIIDQKLPYAHTVRFNLSSIFYYQYTNRNEDVVPREAVIIEDELKRVLKKAGISSKNKAAFQILDAQLYKHKSILTKTFLHLQFILYSFFLHRKGNPTYGMLYNKVLYAWLELHPELYGYYEYEITHYHFCKYASFITDEKKFTHEQLEELQTIWKP